MFWTVFFESKTIFWIEYTDGPICILDNEIRKEILTVPIGIFIDKGKE